MCGSSVSLESVKELLKKCPSISSINLSSCRGLPRGVKRLSQGVVEMTDLKENLGVIERTVIAPPSTQSPSNEMQSPLSSPTATNQSTIGNCDAGGGGAISSNQQIEVT